MNNFGLKTFITAFVIGLAALAQSCFTHTFNWPTITFGSNAPVGGAFMFFVTNVILCGIFLTYTFKKFLKATGEDDYVVESGYHVTIRGQTARVTPYETTRSERQAFIYYFFVLAILSYFTQGVFFVEKLVSWQESKEHGLLTYFIAFYRWPYWFAEFIIGSLF